MRGNQWFTVLQAEAPENESKLVTESQVIPFLCLAVQISGGGGCSSTATLEPRSQLLTRKAPLANPRDFKMAAAPTTHLSGVVM